MGWRYSPKESLVQCSRVTLRRFVSPGFMETLELEKTQTISRVGKLHATFWTCGHLVNSHLVALSLFTILKPAAFSQMHAFRVLI